jgi:membrane dipeptidase
MEEWFVANPDPPATVSDVADHVDHVRDVAGIDHVGMGGDFDGSETMPEGLEDVSRYPALFAELAARGYDDEDLAKVAGRNALRVMREAERTAARLQAERPPSAAAIADLD